MSPLNVGIVVPRKCGGSSLRGLNGCGIVFENYRDPSASDVTTDVVRAVVEGGRRNVLRPFRDLNVIGGAGFDGLIVGVCGLIVGILLPGGYIPREVSRRRLCGVVEGERYQGVTLLGLCAFGGICSLFMRCGRVYGARCLVEELAGGGYRNLGDGGFG